MLINADTIGPQKPLWTRPSADTRAPVGHLSQERIDRGIIDAARSFSWAFPLRMAGSATAALVEFSDECYREVEVEASTLRPRNIAAGEIINPGDN